MSNFQDTLSEREIEILNCLVEGLSNREIANRLFLAYQTVKWYNSEIYTKLGVNNRDDAIKQATELGLIGDKNDSNTPQSTVKHNLPESVTRFIGRKQEITDLSQLLVNEDKRLVTILASGGMGKTRLSMEVARAKISDFSDGVYFVPLAPLTSASDIVTTIAENIGFRFTGDSTPEQQLITYLKDSEMLLILDNFEHLLEGTGLVNDIIKSTPDIKIIVTSRERLNLRGENVYSLRGLEFPTWETPDDALDYDAVKLFVQSAKRIRADFELQTDDLDFMARICRLTTGMPLGIELAAGWVDVLSLEKIAVEIQKGIDILETDLRDMPERQQSIRAVFKQTWDRLTEDEQSVFAKLSIFRGGFTLESAGAVASASLRQLRKLAQKSLIQIETIDRYAIHELLRQFGEEQLTRMGDHDTLRQLHSTYYVDFLAQRTVDIQGRRQFEALQEIRTDFENIRVAWLWAVDHQQVDEIYTALDCLVHALEMNVQFLEVQNILSQTKAKLQSPHPVWDAVSVRLERYQFLLGQGNDGKLLKEILERSINRNDKVEMMWCHWILHNYYSLPDVAERNLEVAIRHAIAFKDLAVELGNEFYLGYAVLLTGTYLRWNDQIEQALTAFRESVSIRRRINDQNNLVFALNVLAEHLVDAGQFAECERCLDEALALEDQIGIVPTSGQCYANKTRLAFWRGDLDIARHYNEIALKITHKQSFIGARGLVLSDSSNLLSIKGHYQPALKLAEESQTYSVNIWARRYMVWSSALVHCGLGHDDLARQTLLEVLMMIVTYTYSPTDIQLCLPITSVLLARAGQTHRAVELLGLVYSAPPELTGWLPHWQLLGEIQNDLKLGLGDQEFNKLWEYGTKLDLTTVVEELLVELV